MPIFEYKCKKCNTIFDVTATYSTLMKNKEKIICPICKSKKTRRVFGKFEVIYKGDGFYTTSREKKNEQHND